MTEPLRCVLEKDVQWHWNDTHEKSWKQVKQLITREPVLKYFDHSKEVTLQCDASESGLGAVILQKGQPIALLSRALTSTERNYAQLEKELLSIVHGCTRFDQYVYGRSITVQTDHKPLETICKKSLLSAPKRLQRMLLQLQRYSLNIVYKPSKELFIADSLSRAFLPNKPSTEELNSEVIAVKHEECLNKSIEEISMVEFLPITSERLIDLRRKTEHDEGLQQLKHIIKNDWPETKEEVLSEMWGYFNFKEELSIHDGILFKGNRVIVPVALRPHMITLVHSSHLCIASCLNKARDVLFWPGMTAEIKNCVSKCETCNTYQTNQ